VRHGTKYGRALRKPRTSEKLVHANFHEKALFVKDDVAAPFVFEYNDPVPLAMLPSALLLVSPLFGGSVHYEIHLFGLIEGAAIFASVSAPRRGWTKFASRSRLMLDPKRSGTEALRLALGELCQDHHLLLFFFSFAASASLLRPCFFL
jgi:hypothetical protein